MELLLGRLTWWLQNVGDQDDIGEVDTELAQQGGHVALLGVQLRFLVDQGEDAQLAILPQRVRAYDVGQEESEATIVVQPPDIDEALRLLRAEQGNIDRR